MAEDVIVAIDGGPASNAAVDWMLDRARTLTLSVELTTVVDLDQAPAGGPEDDFRIVYERALSQAARWVEAAAPNLRKTSVVRRGSPVEELIRASKTADVLVIGTDRTT